MEDLGIIVMFVIGAFADGKINSVELAKFFDLLMRFLSSENSSLSAAKDSDGKIGSLVFDISDGTEHKSSRFSFDVADEGLRLGSTVEPADKSL